MSKPKVRPADQKFGWLTKGLALVKGLEFWLKVWLPHHRIWGTEVSKMVIREEIVFHGVGRVSPIIRHTRPPVSLGKNLSYKCIPVCHLSIGCIALSLHQRTRHPRHKQLLQLHWRTPLQCCSPSIHLKSGSLISMLKNLYCQTICCMG